MKLSLLLLALAIPAYAADPVAPTTTPPAKTNPRKPVKIQESAPEETPSKPAYNPYPYNQNQVAPAGRTSRGMLGVELLGAGLLYSFMGSYLITDQIALNGGISYFSLTSLGVSVGVTQIPISGSYLFGGPNHHFETLAGGDLIIASASVSGGSVADKATASGFLPQIGAGYRYWPQDGGFSFRATMYGMFLRSSFAAWFGLTFGAAF
jgi:hypothetical protein